MIAATAPTPSFCNDIFTYGMFDYIWPNFMPAYGVNGIENESRGFYPAFAGIAGKYFLEQSSWVPNNTTAIDKKDIYQFYHHHGDPFGVIYNMLPDEIFVEHDMGVLPNQNSFTITAEEGAYISLVLNGVILGRAESDGGTITFTSLPALQQGEKLIITVTKRNKLRYRSEVILANEITIKQTRAGQPDISVGEIFHWEGGWQNYDAPATFRWIPGSKHYLKADQRIFEEQKFHNWNENVYYVFDEFNITENTTDIYSYLSEIASATIKNDLAGATAGTIDFKDPWLPVEEIGEYGLRNKGLNPDFGMMASPAELTFESNNKGVHQDQAIIPNKPFYSVLAQQEFVEEFHGRNINWKFQEWDGSGVEYQTPDQLESAVVFRQANAVVRAKYKGHMATADENATVRNGARYITTDPIAGDPVLHHAVYEDEGKIYYTQYRNDITPAGWAEEICLSDHAGVLSCSNPCIAQVAIGVPKKLVLCVVWEEELVFQNEKELVCRILDGRSSPAAWSERATHWVSTLSDIQPVVTGITANNQPQFYILSVNHSAGQSSLEFCKMTDVGSSYIIQDLNWNVYNSTGFAIINPTITSKDNSLYFAWEETTAPIQSGETFYESMVNYYKINTLSPPQSTIIPKTVSDNNAEGERDSRPVIACCPFGSYNVFHLAWEHYGEDIGYTFRHEKLDINLNNTEAMIHQVAYALENLRSPSIGFYTVGTLAGTIQNGDQVEGLYYDGSEWVFTGETFSGSGANLCLSGSMNALWSYNKNGYPYIIDKEELLEPSELNRDNGYIPVAFRKRIFDLSELPASNLTGKISLELGNMQLTTPGGSQPLAFSALSDTMFSADTFQCSQAFTVTQETQQLKLLCKTKLFNFEAVPNMPNIPVYRINLRNTNGQQLANLAEISLTSLVHQPLLKDTFCVDLSGYAGQTVYLQTEVSQSSLNSSASRKTFVHKIVYSPANDENGPGDQVMSATASSANIPKKFDLYQNYPNPFNPSTNIKFDLPQTSPVKLVIYNLNEQVVKTLVSGQKPAGAHKVVWQGKDDNGVRVASGIYIMQLTAGKHQFSKKLMLLK